MSKVSNDEKVLNQNRVLNLLLNYPGEYSKEDLSRYFNISARTIDSYVKEFNLNGFNIVSRLNKYKILEGPKEIEILSNKYSNEDLKKLSLYTILIHKYNGKVLLKDLVTAAKNDCNFGSDSEKYIEKLLRQMKSEEIININKGRVSIKENIISKLSKEEQFKILLYLRIMKDINPKRRIFNEIYEKISLNYDDFNGDFMEISSKNTVSSFDEDYILLLEKAIRQSKNIKFTFVNKGRSKEYIVEPIGLIYNEYKDLWYLYALYKSKKNNFNKLLFRIDKMIRLNILDEKEINSSYMDIFKDSLGVSIEKLTTVKVEFENEEFILRKVIAYKNKRDKARVDIRGEKIILTDWVNGINEFKDWVKSFGKSAICLEPAALIDKIVDDIELLKMRYLDER